LRNISIILIVLFATSWAITPGIATEPTGYLSVTGPCNLEFPKDHGPHPGYRTEWWYYTGNLQDASGKRYGFQLTFFRSQISPPDGRQKWPRPASAWRTQQVYLAHSAISNLSENQHLQAELVSRAALNLAGAKQVADATTIFVKNWSAQINPNRHRLKVQTDAFAYEMILTPQKPPVMHGIAGYSRRGFTADRASCYYSFSRLNTQGKLTIGENVIEVKGSAWMDHEYGTDMLGPGLKGWDWFSLQLSDQTEVMVYVLKTESGGIGPMSSATIIEIKGQNRQLSNDEFRVTVLNTWKSPNSKAVYPAGWRLQIFPGFFDLKIRPGMADQEMLTRRSTGTIYWEGSVSVAGTKAGKPITGKGYVELTGYDRPFKAPM